VLNYLGYSWADQGRNLARARSLIERAAEARPNDGAILDSLGWVILRQGDVAKAVQFLERATELEPEDSAINGHLGDAYWAAGRKLEAEFQWRRSLTLNPEPEDVPKLQAKLRDSEQALHMPMQPVQKAVQ
jgi:Flp pilus assembly protein TadD